MDVVDVEFDRGAVRRTREPQIQILTVLARFEEEDEVAGVQAGEAVEGGVVVVGGLGVEFGVFVGMREE